MVMVRKGLDLPDETALPMSDVAGADLSLWKKGREKKKRDFTKKAFLTLSWPHLGLHLEISGLEISPRTLSWPHLGLHLEIS